MKNYLTSFPSKHWESTFPRSISILGSTGSIGINTLYVIQLHKHLFNVVALSGGKNVNLLAKQAQQWNPKYLAVQDESSKKELLQLLPHRYTPEILVGQKGYAQIASLNEVSTVVSAQVGAAGLRGTIAAAQAGKVICLANKESLVLAGPLIRKICKNSGATILPIDSEHNALLQILQDKDIENIQSIILTASGGPFRGKQRTFLEQVQPEQAIQHPNWKMGKKISVDSATMMNKGFELIEAYYLYGVEQEKIKIIIHPESYIHSLVEFSDNSLMAHMGTPDMRMPIAHCLVWPNCFHTGVKPFDLTQQSSFSFEKPNHELFPCLTLAKEALSSGPSAQIILNAANEIAVDAFLKKRIGFMDIPKLISQALDKDTPSTPMDLEEIEYLDQKTRQTVMQWL